MEFSTTLFQKPENCKFHHVCSADSGLQLICNLGLLNARYSSAARAIFGLISHCGEVSSHSDQKAYVGIAFCCSFIKG